MNFGAVPIDPGALLKLVEKQLQEPGTPRGSNIPGGGFGDLAFLSLWPDQLHLDNPRGKQFVAIRPNRFPVWQSVVSGAGTPLISPQWLNSATGFNAVVTLSCFAQINADPEMRSAQAVSEATLGITSFVLKVIKAVQFWCPCTDNTLANTYLREPARMTDGGFGITPKQGRDGWWVHAPVDLELKFTASF